MSCSGFLLMIASCSCACAPLNCYACTRSRIARPRAEFELVSAAAGSESQINFNSSMPWRHGSLELQTME